MSTAGGPGVSGGAQKHAATDDSPLLGVSRFSVLLEGEEIGVCGVAGLSSGGSVVLRRALGGSRALHDWQLRQDRRRVTIRLHDAAGEPRVEWELAGARPTKWSAPELDASSDDVAIEELELVHEGLEWKEP